MLSLPLLLGCIISNGCKEGAAERLDAKRLCGSSQSIIACVKYDIIILFTLFIIHALRPFSNGLLPVFHLEHHSKTHLDNELLEIRDYLLNQFRLLFCERN